MYTHIATPTVRIPNLNTSITPYLHLFLYLSSIAPYLNDFITISWRALKSSRTPYLHTCSLLKLYIFTLSYFYTCSAPLRVAELHVYAYSHATHSRPSCFYFFIHLHHYTCSVPSRLKNSTYLYLHPYKSPARLQSSMHQFLIPMY